MNVLGIDSGLATCGVAAIALTPDAVRLRDVGVFTSKPSKAKLNVRAADDLARRARELAVFLDIWLNAHQPVAICLEAPSWPRSAGDAAKMATAFGVVYAAAHARGLPIVQAPPQEVKRAVCGTKIAEKDEVILAVERLHPDVCWPSLKSLWQHAADATAVVHACLDSDTIRMARRLSA